MCKHNEFDSFLKLAMNSNSIRQIPFKVYLIHFSLSSTIFYKKEDNRCNLMIHGCSKHHAKNQP